MASVRTRSAGILLYRPPIERFEVLLGHPGGPYYADKDLGSWVIPKGEHPHGESPESAARRELGEELGFQLDVPLVPLGRAQQRAGKQVAVYAAPFLETNSWLEKHFRPGRFEMEWPPKSGTQVSFPELDRISFFPREEAIRRILPSQLMWLDRLEDLFRMDRRASILAAPRGV